jgi:hypothetical protein
VNTPGVTLVLFNFGPTASYISSEFCFFAFLWCDDRVRQCTFSSTQGYALKAGITMDEPIPRGNMGTRKRAMAYQSQHMHYIFDLAPALEQI